MNIYSNFLHDSFHISGEGNLSAMEAFHTVEKATGYTTIDISIMSVLSLLGDVQNDKLFAISLSEESCLEVDDNNELRLDANYVNIKTPKSYRLDSKYPILIDGGIMTTPINLSDDYVFLTSNNAMRHLFRILKINGMTKGFLRDSVLANCCEDLKDAQPVQCVYRKSPDGVKKVVGCFTKHVPDCLHFDDLYRAVRLMNSLTPYHYEIENWSINHRERCVRLSNYVEDSIDIAWSDTGFRALSVQQGEDVYKPESAADLTKLLLHLTVKPRLLPALVPSVVYA